MPFVSFSTTMTTQAESYHWMTNASLHILSISSMTGFVCLSATASRCCYGMMTRKRQENRFSFFFFTSFPYTPSWGAAHTRTQRVFTPSPTDWSSQQRVFQCNRGLTLITIALLMTFDLHSLNWYALMKNARRRSDKIKLNALNLNLISEMSYTNIIYLNNQDTI